MDVWYLHTLYIYICTYIICTYIIIIQLYICKTPWPPSTPYLKPELLPALGAAESLSWIVQYFYFRKALDFRPRFSNRLVCKGSMASHAFFLIGKMHKIQMAYFETGGLSWHAFLVEDSSIWDHWNPFLSIHMFRSHMCVSCVCVFGLHTVYVPRCLIYHVIQQSIMFRQIKFCFILN